MNFEEIINENESDGTKISEALNEGWQTLFNMANALLRKFWDKYKNTTLRVTKTFHPYGGGTLYSGDIITLYETTRKSRYTDERYLGPSDRLIGIKTEKYDTSEFLAVIIANTDNTFTEAFKSVEDDYFNAVSGEIEYKEEPLDESTDSLKDAISVLLRKFWDKYNNSELLVTDTREQWYGSWLVAGEKITISKSKSNKQAHLSFKNDFAVNINSDRRHGLLSIVASCTDNVFAKTLKDLLNKYWNQLDGEYKEEPLDESTNLKIRFWGDCHGYHHGQTDCTLKALDDSNGTFLGYIDYSYYNDEIHINLIRVEEKFQRQGVATALWNQLKKENPGVKINRGMTTSDGTSFLRAIGESTLTESTLRPNFWISPSGKIYELANGEIHLDFAFSENNYKLFGISDSDLSEYWEDAGYNRQNEMIELKVYNQIIKNGWVRISTDIGCYIIAQKYDEKTLDNIYDWAKQFVNDSNYGENVTLEDAEGNKFKRLKFGELLGPKLFEAKGESFESLVESFQQKYFKLAYKIAKNSVGKTLKVVGDFEHKWRIVFLDGVPKHEYIKILSVENGETLYCTLVHTDAGAASLHLMGILDTPFRDELNRLGDHPYSYGYKEEPLEESSNFGFQTDLNSIVNKMIASGKWYKVNDSIPTSHNKSQWSIGVGEEVQVIGINPKSPEMVYIKNRFEEKYEVFNVYLLTSTDNPFREFASAGVRNSFVRKFKEEPLDENFESLVEDYQDKYFRLAYKVAKNCVGKTLKVATDTTNHVSGKKIEKVKILSVSDGETPYDTLVHTDMGTVSLHFIKRLDTPFRDELIRLCDKPFNFNGKLYKEEPLGESFGPLVEGAYEKYCNLAHKMAKNYVGKTLKVADDSDFAGQSHIKILSVEEVPNYPNPIVNTSAGPTSLSIMQLFDTPFRDELKRLAKMSWDMGGHKGFHKEEPLDEGVMDAIAIAASMARSASLVGGLEGAALSGLTFLGQEAYLNLRDKLKKKKDAEEKDKKKKDKKESFKGLMESSNGWWISPSGETFKLTGFTTHAEFIFQNQEKFGISGLDTSTNSLINAEYNAIGRGWVRITDNDQLGYRGISGNVIFVQIGKPDSRAMNLVKKFVKQNVNDPDADVYIEPISTGKGVEYKVSDLWESKITESSSLKPCWITRSGQIVYIETDHTRALIDYAGTFGSPKELVDEWHDAEINYDGLDEKDYAQAGIEDDLFHWAIYDKQMVRVGTDYTHTITAARFDNRTLTNIYTWARTVPKSEYFESFDLVQEDSAAIFRSNISVKDMVEGNGLFESKHSGSYKAWISPTGKVYEFDPRSTHADFVAENIELFNVDAVSPESDYYDLGEQAVRNGWIAISTDTGEMAVDTQSYGSKEKRIIKKWASDKMNDASMSVLIVPRVGSRVEVTVGDLWESVNEEKTETKEFTVDQAKEIGSKIGISFDEVDVEQFRQGLGVESEHMSDPETDVVHGDTEKIGKIAWAHLKEFPDYYTRLKKVEESNDLFGYDSLYQLLGIANRKFQGKTLTVTSNWDTVGLNLKVGDVIKIVEIGPDVSRIVVDGEHVLVSAIGLLARTNNPFSGYAKSWMSYKPSFPNKEEPLEESAYKDLLAIQDTVRRKLIGKKLMLTSDYGTRDYNIFSKGDIVTVENVAFPMIDVITQTGKRRGVTYDILAHTDNPFAEIVKKYREVYNRFTQYKEEPLEEGFASLVTSPPDSNTPKFYKLVTDGGFWFVKTNDYDSLTGYQKAVGSPQEIYAGLGGPGIHLMLFRSKGEAEKAIRWVQQSIHEAPKLVEARQTPIYKSFWISPKGEVIDTNTTHSLFIMENPKIFNIKSDVVAAWNHAIKNDDTDTAANIEEGAMDEAYSRGWIRAMTDSGYLGFESGKDNTSTRNRIHDFAFANRKRFTNWDVELHLGEKWLQGTIDTLISGAIYENTNRHKEPIMESKFESLVEGLLLEFDVQKTKEAFGKKLGEKLKTDSTFPSFERNPDEKQLENMIIDFFEFIQIADPTPRKEYSRWIVQAYVSDGIKRFEDIGSKAAPLLAKYDKLKIKKKLPPESRDIMRIKTISDLYDIVTSLWVEEPTGKDKQRQDSDKAKKESKLVYEDEYWKVYKPETEFAACFFGRGTQWCTAATEGDNMFSYYAEKGNLYIFVPKSGSGKYQLHVVSGQMMDEHDDPYNFVEDKRFYGFIAKLKKCSKETVELILPDMDADDFFEVPNWAFVDKIDSKVIKKFAGFVQFDLERLHMLEDEKYEIILTKKFQEFWNSEYKELKKFNMLYDFDSIMKEFEEWQKK